MHPEQYSNTLSVAQISQLHKSIHYVCGLAVETLADTSKFPQEWLFKHRWTKGKKDAPTILPNGSRFVFLTVGGRTSAVVPSVQKKTGPVNKDIVLDGEPLEEASGEEKPRSTEKKGSKRKQPTEADQQVVNAKPTTKNSKTRKNAESHKEERVQESPDVDGADHEADKRLQKAASKKQKPTAKTITNGKSAGTVRQHKADVLATTEGSQGRRRSGRTSGKQSSTK